MSISEESDESEGPTLGAGFMLWQVTNGWQRVIRAALAPTGLTYVQIVLLAGLKDKLAEGSAVSQAALAQALGADPMMTSQVLRTLETGGLIKRERNPADTRSKCAIILRNSSRPFSTAAGVGTSGVRTRWRSLTGRPLTSSSIAFSPEPPMSIVMVMG